MVDHLTSLPIAKAIPDKEATTVANAIFDKLILEHGNSEILSDNGKEFTNDKTSWDQVLDQILFSYRCCPHTLLVRLCTHLCTTETLPCPYKN